MCSWTQRGHRYNGIYVLLKLVPTAHSKTSSAEDKDEDAYPSGKPNENSQEEETDTSAEVVQPIMTYSILDQSILNWPAIQVFTSKVIEMSQYLKFDIWSKIQV